jgi:hypothetical protein
MKTTDDWTLPAYIAHNEALRAAEARFAAERDLRYQERDESSKAAVKAALFAAERASEKTEMALKEYKVGANEWRDTVKDLISARQGKSEGVSASWAVLLGAAALIATLIVIGAFVFDEDPAPAQGPAPQVFYVPAAPGTLIPSQSSQSSQQGSQK